MDTTTSAVEVADRIAAAALSRFAEEHGITPGHLLTAKADLTTVECLRAVRALGAEVVYP